MLLILLHSGVSEPDFPTVTRCKSHEREAAFPAYQSREIKDRELNTLETPWKHPQTPTTC